MRPGLGFRGSLSNVDLSADHSIDHVTIDESPQLHARVIAEVLAIVGGRPPAAPAAPAAPKPVSIATPTKSDDGAIKATDAPVTPSPRTTPVLTPQPVDPAQVRD